MAARLFNGMNRKFAFLLIPGALSIVAILVRWNAESVGAAPTPEAEFEIGQDLYALLADEKVLPADRLEEVRRLLIDDGKISLCEFESLGLSQNAGLNSKQQLFQRLKPELAKGIFLHPDEPKVLDVFSICTLKPPQTETDPIEVGGATYQLRHFHFCGYKRVSGFSLYRNGEEINSVRHFGHGSAEANVNPGNICYFRRDLSSAEAYRLLQAFYDGAIDARAFFFAIIEPTALQYGS
jgi:hypothetical protein